MPLQQTVTPNFKFAGTHSYNWVERGTVGIKCLVQEHSTIFPASVQTQTACSLGKHTNHNTSKQLLLHKTQHEEPLMREQNDEYRH